MSYGLCKTEKFEEVRLGGWEVPHHRSGLIYSTHSLHPTMTTAWCTGKSLTGIMQGMEGVRALGTGEVGQGLGTGKH